MKEGRSLNDVARELDRQRVSKRDFLADTRNVVVRHDGSALVAELLERPRAVSTIAGTINTHALRQLEQHLGVPAKFADRLQERHPDLLVHNLNELLHRDPSTQLLRFLDDKLRAFLSRIYRIIDNYDFANAVLEVAGKFKCRVASCEVTESRLYIKVVRTDLVERIGWQDGWEMGRGNHLFDEVQAAAVFSNSEVGDGALWFYPGIYTRRCTNLATFEQNALKKVHLGRGGEAGESGIWEMLSDQTKAMSDAALWGQVKDLTAAALDGRLFQQNVELLREKRGERIEGDVVKTMELTAERFGLNEQERGGILTHLIHGGDLTQYGLHSAITRFSQDVEDYDRASELERLGGKVIELPPQEFRRLLAKAA